MRRGKPRPALALHLLGERTHGFRGNLNSFAAIDRGLRKVDCAENLSATTLALDPKCQGGLDSVFRTPETAARDSLPDELLLLGREVYLHAHKRSMTWEQM